MLLILFVLPAVMLSGFMSPIESMPRFFQWLTVDQSDPLLPGDRAGCS
jgi:ABC-type multidrug transport system permease subunit